MYGIDKNGERQAMVRTVRQFANEVVAPVAAELDQQPNPEDCFSWDMVERASAVGIRTLTLTGEYGGAGADSLTAAMVIEELAKVDLGVSVIFAQTLKIAQTLQHAATKEQKERFLPKCSSMGGSSPGIHLSCRLGCRPPRSGMEAHYGSPSQGVCIPGCLESGDQGDGASRGVPAGARHGEAGTRRGCLPAF